MDEHAGLPASTTAHWTAELICWVCIRSSGLLQFSIGWGTSLGNCTRWRTTFSQNIMHAELLEESRQAASMWPSDPRWHWGHLVEVRVTLNPHMSNGISHTSITRNTTGMCALPGIDQLHATLSCMLPKHSKSSFATRLRLCFDIGSLRPKDLGATHMKLR